VLHVKSYRSVFFLDIFISFGSISKYCQTIWKLIWLIIRLIHENSWLPPTVGHDIHMRIPGYFRRPGYSPNNCNGTNSTSKRFRTLYVTVLYKRNWISRGGRFHHLSTPLLYIKNHFFHIFPFSCTLFMIYFSINIHAKEKSVPLSTLRIWWCIFLAKPIFSIMYYKLERTCKVFRKYYWVVKYAFNRKPRYFYRNTHPILLKILWYIQLLMLYQTI
jgi:hypothetical protein